MNDNKKTMTAAELAKFPPHPLKNAFWSKPMALPATPEADAEADAFKESIARSGVNVPVIICNGQVVDGLRRIGVAILIDSEMKIPVFECDENQAELTALNALMQTKSLTKFQRIFTAYPALAEGIKKLVEIAETKFENQKNLGGAVTALPKTPNATNLGAAVTAAPKSPNVTNVNESVVICGVSISSLSELAKFLNVSDRWLRYCKNVYDTIALKIANGANEAEVYAMAHKFVFDGEVPVERIASAIGGYDSERNPEQEEEEKSFAYVSVKVNDALKTALDRMSKDSYLAPERQEQIKPQIENFALKLPDSIAEILYKSLSKRMKTNS